MTNKELYIQFGGLTFAFTGWVPSVPEESLLAPFVIERQASDIHIHIYQDEILDIPGDAQLLYAGGTYCVNVKGNRIWAQCCTLEGRTRWTYAILHIDANAPDQIALQILQPNCSFTIDNILSNVMMESLMLAHDRAIFHAATIAVDGRAILFTAPSGTGKSTQAELWHRYRGAEVVNGDKILLHQQNGVQLACGLPYAGTSGISKNRTLPIGAIVVLSQGKVNQLRAVPPVEATKTMLSQICLQTWHAQDISNALDIVQRVITHVPIYHLACLPDESAVQCLEPVLK